MHSLAHAQPKSSPTDAQLSPRKAKTLHSLTQCIPEEPSPVDEQTSPCPAQSRPSHAQPSLCVAQLMHSPVYNQANQYTAQPMPIPLHAQASP
jgi:hypothetical protein